MRRLLFVAALAVLALPVSAAAQIPITGCGTEIPPKQTGVLQNDLDCTGTPGRCRVCNDGGCSDSGPTCTSSAECTGPDEVGCAFPAGVTLGKGATLDMAGHAIVGHPGATAIECPYARSRCKVTSSTGRGDVTGDICVRPGRNVRLAIENVDVHDCDSGIESFDISAFVEATDVTSNRNAHDGIRARKIVANDVTASENGFRGLSAEAGPLIGRNVVVADNGSFGAVSYRPFTLDQLTATGNGPGTVVGDGGGLWGIKSGGKLTNSTLTGNVYQDEGGTIAMDILSAGRPRTTSTTCDRSGGRRGLSNSWGVCTND
jgi:hypothetical protein